MSKVREQRKVFLWAVIFFVIYIVPIPSEPRCGWDVKRGLC